MRLRVEKRDDRGRVVAAGSVGAVVHTHPASRGSQGAYIVEVVIIDAAGRQIDAHVIDATEIDLEPV